MANSYTITGDDISPSASTDPELCRITGNVKNIMGQPVIGIGFTVVHCYAPLTLATDTLLIRERYDIQTESDGSFVFDAIRGAEVRVEIRNRHDLSFQVSIPDAAQADFIDLILPYIVSAAFVDASPLEVSVGARFNIAVNGTLSNGELVPVASGSVMESSNEAVVALDGTASFRAVSVGTAEISILSINEDVLGLWDDPSGNPITRFSVPATTLPAALTVNVV